MRAVTRTAALLLVLLSALPRSSGAAPAPDADAQAAKAKEHYLRGQRLYEVAKFAEALEAFTAAYETKALPALLFNIGQCHRRLGHHDAALFFFRGYLGYTPDASDQADVEQLISQEEAARAADELAQRESARREELRLREGLRARQAPAPVAPVVVPAPVSSPTTTPVHRRWWFWTAIAGVVAVGATAAVVATSAGGDGPLPTDTLGRIDAR